MPTAPPNSGPRERLIMKYEPPAGEGEEREREGGRERESEAGGTSGQYDRRRNIKDKRGEAMRRRRRNRRGGERKRRWDIKERWDGWLVTIQC